MKKKRMKVSKTKIQEPKAAESDPFPAEGRFVVRWPPLGYYVLSWKSGPLHSNQTDITRDWIATSPPQKTKSRPTNGDVEQAVLGGINDLFDDEESIPKELLTRRDAVFGRFTEFKNSYRSKARAAEPS